jgi:hypothetical protein
MIPTGGFRSLLMRRTTPGKIDKDDEEIWS